MASAWGRATVTEMRRSNVLQPRVVLTTLLPRAGVRAALRRSGTSTVLTPDPRVLERLGGTVGSAPVLRLPSGAPRDDRRARPDELSPVVVFAGRAETVRGVDTLLAAFPEVRRAVPGARLRLPRSCRGHNYGGYTDVLR
jgi:glycosyltransferase involved in cell wall biosynthesis